MLNDIIPAAWRKPVYAAYALAGAIIGAVQVGYLSAEAGQPLWLTVTLAVYGFIGTAIGFTASANTPTVGKITGDESVIPEPDELAGVTDTAEDDIEVTGTAEDDEDIDEIDPSDEAGVPNVHDVAQAEDQAALDAALLADQDDTPPPEGYRPAH